jgi:hypothetical protein
LQLQFLTVEKVPVITVTGFFSGVDGFARFEWSQGGSLGHPTR